MNSVRFLASPLRRALAVSVLAVGALGTAPAFAQDTTPIKMLVGFPAGGSTDAIARSLALGMEKSLGRPVVVENRAGAGGQIAAQVLKGSKPDGLTIFLTNSHAITMIPHTLKAPGYDVAKDFAPVSLVAFNPDVFAVSTTVAGNPADLKEFAAWAQKNAGKGNVGVPAPASAPDFVVSGIAKALAADLKSAPYRGDGPVAQDLVAGQIAGGVGSVGVMLPQVATGKVKILAVNGTQRVSSIPNVPTYAELGLKGLDDQIFTSVIVPAGTPADIIARYNAAIAAAVAAPEMKERLSSLGITLVSSTPEALGQRIQASSAASLAMMKAAGYTPQ
ncbi:tripartite tricarboxylate transporter substrate-binding protein [Variovorax sp. VNK109]|uniref:tripartite tricarboxylate transporter substrate-binding protein n=1 Tax=Variovorax sp. VNK109 TaxID=3400919 RepID=UPI003C0E5348